MTKPVSKRQTLKLFPAPSERQSTIDEITAAIEVVNSAVLKAVDAGISVELVRTSRCHDGNGNWGDQMASFIWTPLPQPGNTNDDRSND